MSSKTTEQAPLWREILSGSSANSPANAEAKTLVVLGEEGAGKEALINSLRRSGSEQGTRTALEYTYIDPFGPEDDQGELSPRLNVWKLNGLEHKDILKFALNPRALNSTMVLMVLDFAKPWSFLTSLTQWMEVLEQQLLAVYDECAETGLDTEHQQAQVKWFQNYVEPAKEDSGSPRSGKMSSFAGEGNLAGGDDIVLPLGEGTLTSNLGVPIVIACNKADMMATLEKNFEYQDSDFEFIQQHLRKFALSYGATLVYTSTKTGKGSDILGEYVAHRLLSTPFNIRAQVLDKDTLFVPAGYDSLERITVLNDHTKTGGYEDVIAAPVSKARTARTEEMVSAQDDQEFLEMHKGTLDKLSKGDRPARSAAPSVELFSGAPDVGTTAAAAGAAPGAAPTASSLTPGSSAMLQNFFESLMKSESNEGLRKDVEGVIADEKRRTGQ